MPLAPGYERGLWERLKSKEVQKYYCCVYQTCKFYSFIPKLMIFIAFDPSGSITISRCTIPIWLQSRHGSFERSQKRVKEATCLGTSVAKVRLLLFPFPEIWYINRFICSETIPNVLVPPGVNTLPSNFLSFSTNECMCHADSRSHAKRTTLFSNPELIMSKCDPYFGQTSVV